MSFPLLTPVTEAPYWRAMDAAAFEALTGFAPHATARDVLPGWEKAAYRCHCAPLGYATLVGWARAPFAISDLSLRGFPPFGELTHLPTGNWVGLFGSTREAAFAADVLLPITDWPALTVEAAPLMVEAVCAALENAGFVSAIERTPPVPVQVWRRAALH